MRFWYWWTVALGGVLASVLSWYFFDLLSMIQEYDKTGISFGIMVIGFLMTFTIAFYWDDLSEKVPDIYWFVTDAVLSLGMVGTLIGFMMIMTSQFGSVNVGNTEEIKALLSNISQGMGTGLITTLVGLITSVWLKWQLVIVESDDR